jgi:hypothetical protein
MARTRLKQLEQVRSSLIYDDNMNMGAAAESQPAANVGTTATITSITAPDTIIVSGNLVQLGINNSDKVTLTGGNNDGIVATVSAASYNGTNDETTIVVVSPSSSLTTDAVPTTTLQATVDPYKNLSTDLNYIRTQLRKLNKRTNWYDNPLEDPVTDYQLITGTAYSVNQDIILPGSKTFDAGEPYTLKVYLNGQLMLPSTVSGGVVTSQCDYVEKDSSGPVEVNEVGDRIAFAFAIYANDLIQLRWTKKQA